MQSLRRACTLLLAVALALAACGERRAGDTAVMGGARPGSGAPEPFEAIAPPDVPPSTEVRMVRTGEASAVAVWLQDGAVLASTYQRPHGWSRPQPLEQIYGEASDPQLAGNGSGQAMALWRHTVGSIQSLRYSRFDAAGGWSPPDVLPGALPRPPVTGEGGDPDAPQLQMDAQGHVTARWPSGFDAAQMQVAQHVPGRGWSRPASEPMAAAGPAAPVR